MIAPRQLAPGLWRLGSHHVASYLMAGGERAAIFEVGVGATAPLVLAQVDSLGLARQRVEVVVLSHAHADHATGQAALLAGLPRAELLLSSASRDFLAKPGTAQRYAAEDGHTSPQVAGREGLAGGPWPLGPLLPGRPRVVAPGDELDLGGLRLRLMAADGHVPGGLICHLPEVGALLASDSAGFCARGRPGFPLYFVSHAQYLDTLATLAELGAGVLGLGHQDCFQGPAVAAFLGETRELLERERQSIRRGRAQGRDEEELASAIFRRYYLDELTVYSPENILACCRLLVRRSLEEDR